MPVLNWFKYKIENYTQFEWTTKRDSCTWKTKVTKIDSIVDNKAFTQSCSIGKIDKNLR